MVAAKELARLSFTELAIWLGVSRPTIWSWAVAGKIPAPFRLPEIIDRIALLERAIELDWRLPVPLAVTQYKRQEYVRGILNDWVSGKLPPPRPTR